MGPLALAGIQAGAGVLQGIIGGIGARKARRALEREPTPTYSPVKSITDYYNESQRRYQESPYQSNLYKMQAQNIERGTNQGLTAMQNQRRGQGSVAGIIQAQNDALLKAGVAAEQQRDQRFAQLGSATGAMAGEQRKAWEVNQLMPYEKRMNILGQKAAGYTQLMNAGIQNAFGGLQTGIMAKSGLGYGSSKNDPFSGFGNVYSAAG